jgi:hypothetical protein
VSVTVSLHLESLTRLVAGPGGPGDRYLHRKTEQVAALSRINAVPHGSMTATIQAAYPRPKVGTVTNLHPAALFVENGTRRHEIRPRSTRRSARLRFVPTGGSSFVFARRVSHPGNRAFAILQRALHDAL